MIEPRDVLEALLFASEAPVEPTVIRDVLDLPSRGRGARAGRRPRRASRGAGPRAADRRGRRRIPPGDAARTWRRGSSSSRGARRKSRLSRPALETLAIIAYRQPVSRPEVDATRGVNSEGVLDNLLERRLIRIAGRKETAGRPFLYETTREFLVAFGLRDLGDLPKVEGELVVVDPAAPPRPPSAMPRPSPTERHRGRTDALLRKRVRADESSCRTAVDDIDDRGGRRRRERSARSPTLDAARCRARRPCGDRPHGGRHRLCRWRGR